MQIAAVIIAGIAAVGVMVAVYGGIRSSATDEVGMRLNRYVPDGSAAASDWNPQQVTSPRDRVNGATDFLNGLLSRWSRSGKLADDLQRADLRIKTSEWLLGVAGVGILLGALLGLRFGSPLLFLVGVALAWFGSGIYLRFRQGRRLRAFEKQLGDTVILLSNSLKAGYSFAQAMSTVTQSAHPPISEEFSRATREIALGIPVDDALRHLVERNRSDDFDLLVTAVQVHRVVGGNLAEILDMIAETIRERVRIKGEIRTLTAQARMSGWIITLLPIGLAGILEVISPSYFGPMLHETFGLLMLGVAGVMMLIGFAIIQKIVKIEV